MNAPLPMSRSFAIIGMSYPMGAAMRRKINRIWRNTSGQDMLEYALITATIAVVVAGFLPPSILPSVSSIFSRITSTLALS